MAAVLHVVPGPTLITTKATLQVLIPKHFAGPGPYFFCAATFLSSVIYMGISGPRRV